MEMCSEGFASSGCRREFISECMNGYKHILITPCMHDAAATNVREGNGAEQNIKSNTK